jgi:hypothetical protein
MMSRIESKFDRDVEQTLCEASWLLGEHPLFRDLRAYSIRVGGESGTYAGHVGQLVNQVEALKHDGLEAGYGSADASSTEHG